MWQRNKKMIEMKAGEGYAHPEFANMFLAQSLHQTFNHKGFEFRSDENESAIVKYSRRLIANQA